MSKMEKLPLLNKEEEPYLKRLLSIFIYYLPMGFITFGGPPAHLGIAHEQFVHKLNWLSDERFLELVSLGSALPGPTSTQVITAIGILRAGPLGGIIAFLMWMLPMFVVMTLAGIGTKNYFANGSPIWLIGLAPAAVAMVIIASLRLCQKACGDSKIKMALTAISGCVVLLTSSLNETWIFPAMMIAGGCVTLFCAKYFNKQQEFVKSNWESKPNSLVVKQIGIPPVVGIFLLVSWFVVLIVLTYLDKQGKLSGTYVSLFYTFYKIGSIIFGGGQVMLPMLLNDIVHAGLVQKDAFLTGFALIQSLPGPLFNFSSYLGAVHSGNFLGAAVAALGFFGPGIYLMFGLLPLWERVRTFVSFQIFLAGVNSVAVGLVVAAVGLLWEKAVLSHASASIVLGTTTLVAFFKIPGPVAIAFGGIVGFLLAYFNVAQANYCATAK